MRYEFHRDEAFVGSAQWEGPGQVAIDVRDRSVGPEFARFFQAEEVYLGPSFDPGDGGLQVRRRDWTPWEFERACRALAHRMGFRAVRVPSGPVERRSGEGAGL